mmetsp:Transcript_115544/g.172644  ORF Transcript_115544/g.172644 Transcript_115544/m.172644 type:complete len:201 (-) Transcript_115544:44-646(-)
MVKKGLAFLNVLCLVGTRKNAKMATDQMDKAQLASTGLVIAGKTSGESLQLRGAAHSPGHGRLCVHFVLLLNILLLRNLILLRSALFGLVLCDVILVILGLFIILDGSLLLLLLLHGSLIIKLLRFRHVNFLDRLRDLLVRRNLVGLLDFSDLITLSRGFGVALDVGDETLHEILIQLLTNIGKGNNFLLRSNGHESQAE